MKNSNFLLGLFLAGAFFASASSDSLADEPAIGKAINDVPIFDAHMHYKRPAWEPYPVATVIELMDRNGVAMALVSSTPDEGTIRLWQYAPSRIVPELRPYHNDAGSSNWTKAKGMQGYLEERLARYPHEGIGEFHIHQMDPTDKPLLAAIAKMALSRNIPVHIHSGAEPIRGFYEIEPRATIIWAHAGMSEPADIVGQMLDRYPTLYADTSFRERDILTNDDSLSPDWRRVIYRHADRLMIGTDTWVNGQWDDYDGLISLNRQWLSLLPRELAEKIAFRNAGKLFKRDVSMELLGTR